MSRDAWLAIKTFCTVMAVGHVVILTIGLARMNWTAVGWACFGLLSALTSIALARSAMRVQP